MKTLIIVTLSTLVAGGFLSGCARDSRRPLPHRPPGKGEFLPVEVSLKTVTVSNLFELSDERLMYTDSDGTSWVAPHGAYTDGATVPRIALPVSDGRFDARFLKAAIIHDAYCQECNQDRCPDQYRKRPWESVHLMFYDAMLSGGTPETLAQIMFSSVWWFGPTWDDPDTARNEVSEEALERAFGGSADWIERNKPTIKELTTDLKHREKILVNLYRFETKSNGALRNGQLADAAKLLEEEQSSITKALAERPNDPMLLNYQGFLLKNQATLAERQGKITASQVHLKNAEAVFERVLREQPSDPSASTGMGEISLMRGDLDKAESLLRRTTLVSPEFKPARNALERVREKKLVQPVPE